MINAQRDSPGSAAASLLSRWDYSIYSMINAQRDSPGSAAASFFSRSQSPCGKSDMRWLLVVLTLAVSSSIPKDGLAGAGCLVAVAGEERSVL